MKDQIRIMLIEPDVLTCEAYREAVAQMPDMELVFHTGQQTQAVDYLRTRGADVVIMEMELAEGDGISLLDEITDPPEEKPLIVLSTDTASRATLGYMRMNGVDLVCRKLNKTYSPAYVLQMVEKLYPYRFFAEPDGETGTVIEQLREELDAYALRRQVQTELEEMGFRHKMAGFRYLLDAIVLCVEHKDTAIHVSGWLYPEIAKRWNTTEACIERAMRWAIESVFTKENIAQMNQQDKFHYDEENARPSNVEFILNMADKFEKWDGRQKTVTDDREV